MKKKPYKSTLSNILWCFRKQLAYAPGMLVMYALQTPVRAGLQYAAIYLPSLVVAEVTEGQTLTHAALSVGLLMLAVLLGGLLDKLFHYLILGKQGFYLYRLTYELNRKSLTCFYQQYERKEMRDLSERAQKATEMWDGIQPVQDLPRQTWSLIEGILCYFLFGAVISLVSPWLLLILTLTPAINWLCVRTYQSWSYKNRGKWTDIDSRISYVHKKTADFSLAKDIRIYGMSGWFKSLYLDLTKEREQMDREQALRQFLSRIPDLLVILLRDSIAYLLLISMAIHDGLTADRFVLYFAAISSFAGWVGKILDSLGAMHRLSLSVCDLREYLEYPEENGSGEASTASLLKAPPKIVFDRVSFRYESDAEDVLCNISFTIHPGEKIALVGPNGAGKTTLVKLLCGLYLPTEGDIRIGGHSVREFLRDDYYRLFSPVFQDVRTAFFSLAETVSGRPGQETDLDRAKACMCAAGLTEKLASLPDGIHTKLDKQLYRDGTELSGGELQKLMLARALYKDAPILVLDEPTSALDPIAENEIYLKYNEMSKDKSSLFISHRLASTRFCDRILFLRDGCIAEEGTHDALLANDGEYAKLFRMQSSWYHDTDHGFNHNIRHGSSHDRGHSKSHSGSHDRKEGTDHETV